jgi:ABC-type transporter Mla maintaining outer membrane lipid asymmetry ATPase subunit MlaF
MIHATGLRKAYGDQVVLDGVDLSIGDGEFVYLVGQSGEGKTVLGRCLFGLETVDAGSTRIDGFEMVGANPRDLHRVRMSYVYVFQHPTLFDSFTVEENIALPLRYHRTGDQAEVAAQVERWLDLAGVREYRRAYPSELPFGAQKKVSLARALSLKPKGLILDEPTTGLDRATADALTDLVLTLHAELKLTTVLISHDRPNILRTASRVVLITRGRLVDARLQRDGAHTIAIQGDPDTILGRFLGLSPGT